MRTSSIREVDIADLKLFRRGKVRDVYELGDKLLFVATDRISCFDVVLPDPIPLKGVVLNRISLLWFELTKDIIANHFLSSDISGIAELKDYQDIFNSYLMLLKYKIESYVGVYKKFNNASRY